jgi:hypothetical protein
MGLASLPVPAASTGEQDASLRASDRLNAGVSVHYAHRWTQALIGPIDAKLRDGRPRRLVPGSRHGGPCRAADALTSRTAAEDEATGDQTMKYTELTDAQAEAEVKRIAQALGVDPAAVWPWMDQMRAGHAGDVVVAKAADSSR